MMKETKWSKKNFLKKNFFNLRLLSIAKIMKFFYFLLNINFHHFPKKKQENLTTSPLQKKIMTRRNI